MQYRIGSFNMKNFGANPKRDFATIARIILEERLDVVALQEILSEGKGVRTMLEQCVKYQLYDWDFCWASPNDSSDLNKLFTTIQGDRRGEGYAYIWNRKAFKLVETQKMGKSKQFSPRIVNSLSNDVMSDCSFLARAPYYIRLEPIYGGFFELRLINIHIYWGSSSLADIQKRKLEYEFLVGEIYPSISQRRYGNFRAAYTIAMGDYNLNILKPFTTPQAKNAYINEVYNYNDGKKQFSVLTTQDQLSTLKAPALHGSGDGALNHEGYANNYDHFSYSPQLTHFTGVSCSVVDAVQKYCNGDFAYYRDNISDHLPVIMEIEI